MLIRAETSCLIVIDMQERLVPAMQAPAQTMKSARLLLAAAAEIGVPTLVTEQYPKGLGHTVAEIADAARAAGAQVIEKMHFSSWDEPDFASAFREIDRPQAVIAGMEAHICVLQTAMSLMREGVEVFVVTDATASRSLASERACLDRLQAAGAGIVTAEMAVFEWLGRAGTPAFRALLPLVK
ncbi:MAG: isochorismatase family protein [Pikeienuella sp.]